MDGRGRKLDEWCLNKEEATRVHHKPRRELFTPLRVAGAPPAKRLTPARITEGRFVGTGECFRHVDSWTTRATSHTDMGQLWTGVTRFLVRIGDDNTTEQAAAQTGLPGALKQAVAQTGLPGAQPPMGRCNQSGHLSDGPAIAAKPGKDHRGSKLGDHSEALSRPAFLFVAAAAAERELRIPSANNLISEFNSGAFYMTGLACSMLAFPSKFEHNNQSRRIRSVATLDSRADRAVGGCALNAPRQGKS